MIPFISDNLFDLFHILSPMIIVSIELYSVSCNYYFLQLLLLTVTIELYSAEPFRRESAAAFLLLKGEDYHTKQRRQSSRVATVSRPVSSESIDC